MSAPKLNARVGPLSSFSYVMSSLPGNENSAWLNTAGWSIRIQNATVSVLLVSVAMPEVVA